MDSGNSGSLNSSSCGDDEYDSSSRTDHQSISAFLNSSSNQQPPLPPPPPPHHHQQSSIFDPHSTYLDPFSLSPPTQSSTTPNSLLNLDMVWPKTLIRSEPNCTSNTNIDLMGSSSTQVLPQYGSGRIHFQNPSSNSLQPAATAPDHQNAAIIRGSTSSHDHHQTTATTRNSKKRSRASRRAPTTVLTTDTSNFRAMVQEFTGIPAPPFSVSSSFLPRSRFDLFNTSSTMKLGHLETLPRAPPPPPPYLLRPFPHKVHHQLPSFLTSNISTTSNSTSTTTNNCLIPSEIGLSKEPHHHHHHQNLLNMQNPILTFQSLLQPDHHHQVVANVPILSIGDKSKGRTRPGETTISSSNDSQLKMGVHVLEEFNIMSSTHGGGSHEPNSHLGGVLSNIVTNINGDDHHHHDQQSHLNSSFKMNFSASSISDFNTGKGSSEKVSTRGEGTLDNSWICSSSD